MEILSIIKKNRLEALFHDQFKKISQHIKLLGYIMDIEEQSACLVINFIMVYNYGFFFNHMALRQI